VLTCVRLIVYQSALQRTVYIHFIEFSHSSMPLRAVSSVVDYYNLARHNSCIFINLDMSIATSAYLVA